MAEPSPRQMLAAVAGSAGLAMKPDAATAFPASYYRGLVPEIFAGLVPPPAYTPNLVIGSGFGGAISALRSARSGQTVTIVERGFRWPKDPWRFSMPCSRARSPTKSSIGSIIPARGRC